MTKSKQNPQTENQNPYGKTYVSKRKQPGVTISEASPTSTPSKRVKKGAEKPNMPPKKLTPKRKKKEILREESRSSSDYSLSDTESDTPKAEAVKKRRGTDASSSAIPIVLHEQLMKWFNDEAQAKVYSEKYLGKTVKVLKFLDFSELSETNLRCISLLEDQGLRNFLEFKGDVYPDLVKVFFCNLQFSHNLIKSKVKGTSIKMKLSQFIEMFRLDQTGVDMSDDTHSLETLNSSDVYNSMLRPGQIRRLGKQVLSTGPINADDRVLHYILSYVLFPRASNHAIITESDIPLMYAVKERIKVKWAEEFCYHMLRCRNFSTLPYGYHISHILRVFNVDLSGEVVLKPKSQVSLINKLYLQINLNLGWNLEKGAYDYASGFTKNTEPRDRPSAKKPETSKKASVDTIQILEGITELRDEVEDIKTHQAVDRSQSEVFRTEVLGRLSILESLIHSLIMSQTATRAASKVAHPDPELEEDIDARVDACVEAEIAQNKEACEFDASEIPAVASDPSQEHPVTSSIPSDIPVDNIIQNVISDVSRLESPKDI